MKNKRLRRSGGQTFQTGAVVRAAAFIGVFLMLLQENMTRFRMHQSVHSFPLI